MSYVSATRPVVNRGTHLFHGPPNSTTTLLIASLTEEREAIQFRPSLPNTETQLPSQTLSSVVSVVSVVSVGYADNVHNTYSTPNPQRPPATPVTPGAISATNRSADQKHAHGMPYGHPCSNAKHTVRFFSACALPLVNLGQVVVDYIQLIPGPASDKLAECGACDSPESRKSPMGQTADGAEDRLRRK